MALLERQRRRQDCGGALDLLSWTMVRRGQLGPSKPFDLAIHPYLADIYNETAQRMVVYKAGQMGASEWAISYVLHACDERNATCLYVFPTSKHVSDFSAARIGPAIEASEYLEKIIIEGGATGRRRGADRVLLKRVRDRFIYFRGARVDPEGNAPQLKSVDADCLVLDEVDEMDQRAPTIAEKRLGHSRIAEERWVSTPTYPNMGIHAKWQESDQREWHVKCRICNTWQALTIQQVVTEWDQLGRPVEWNGKGTETAWVACVKCGHELDRLGAGQWVATYPERELRGYHLTKLFSFVTDVVDLVEALITTDETQRKEAFNQDLGEPYVPRGGQLTDGELDGCRREYGHGPVRGEQTVMGVDVGKVLHAVIRGPADVETGERAQRWAGEVESFEGLGRLMRRFGVGACVIDALPETRKAREFQAEWERKRVWLAYYVTQKIGSKRQEPVQWNLRDGVVNLDRTRTLDQMLAGFYEETSTLPANARMVLDYYDHLKAMVRVLEDSQGGQKVARYVETGPDHLAHAENYCGVADAAPSRARLLAQSYQG